MFISIFRYDKTKAFKYIKDKYLLAAREIDLGAQNFFFYLFTPHTYNTVVIFPHAWSKYLVWNTRNFKYGNAI